MGDDPTLQHKEGLRKMLFDDFMEILQHVNSPLVSRPWDPPIHTTWLMRRQRLHRLSPAEKAELCRLLKNAVGADFARLSRSKFGSPILFVS
jgi:hypothetical protein